MNEKVVEFIQKLRGSLHVTKEHKVILADMFLEEGIVCAVQEVRWDTLPRHKITLIVEIFP